MPREVAPWANVTFAALGTQYAALVVTKVASLYLVGCAFYFIERLRPVQPDARFFKRDFKTEVCYPLFNILVSTPVVTLLLVAATTFVLQPFAPHHVLAAHILALPFVPQVVAALVVADLAVYVEHRFIAHALLWDYHALHHMTPEVSWLTTVRVHPVNAVTIALTAGIMTWVIGFEGRAVVVAAWISSALAMWEHANLELGFPKPWCWLLVSPRFHRWHHAREAEAVDKNFCLIFPFIDLAFGTYYCPERFPTGYGLLDAHDRESDRTRDGIPDGFMGQLRYPFQKTLERTQALLRV